jgi:hypothetical protein
MQRLNRMMIIVSLVSFAGLSACDSGADSESTASTDKQAKTAAKADAWDYRNAPDRFRVDLDYTLANLPKSGKALNDPWTDTYWPTYQDSVNVRWQKNLDDYSRSLSPIEKYDVVFNGWDPQSVKDLRPFDSDNCDPESWDAEYYEKLGPAASYISRYKGNQRTRDAVTNGRVNEFCKAIPEASCVTRCDECLESCESEDQECREGCLDDKFSCNELCTNKDEDRGGVETWWGLCHAWVPAAVLEAEPKQAVEYEGITFDVSDIKALLILAYDQSKAHMIGGRCNEKEVERDEDGRIKNSECRDTNAGTFHVIVTNFLGKMKRAFAEDRTYNYEVWNQPVIGYEVESQEDITKERAIELVGLEGDEYSYNTDATRFALVQTSLDWVGESEASTIPESIEHYTSRDHYVYILEMNDDGVIIGGEWLTTSGEGPHGDEPPDFLWLPVGSYDSKVPGFSLENVRKILALARPAESQPAEGQSLTVVSEERVAIPDNDPKGAVSTLTVDENFVVAGLEVSVDISHTWIGDLQVSIQHEGVKVMLHNGTGGSEDNLVKTFEIGDFDGAQSTGEWSLHLVDSAGQDVGSLLSWSLQIGRTR